MRVQAYKEQKIGIVNIESSCQVLKKRREYIGIMENIAAQEKIGDESIVAGSIYQEN